MNESKGRVIVAHPGAASSIYELAAAVAGLGWELDFQTGFFHDPTGTLGRLAARWPKLDRELRRRSFARIDPAHAHQHRVLELAYVLSARLGRRNPGLPAAIMHWRNRRFDAAVAAQVRNTRPAIVIGHDTSCIATIRAARAAGAKSVVNQLIGHVAVGDQILGEEAKRFPDWADSLHAGAPDWLVRQCLDEVLEADAVLCPSDYVRQTLEDVGVRPEAIRMLPFGVRVERFTPPERPRADGVFRLLYVGQISQRKGLAYALEAVKRIGRKDIELVLVGGLVGQGRGLAAYEGWFRHVPNVPFHEIAALYQTADALIYPSLHEGSALAIFEGMASGLPVITTVNSGSFVRDGQDGVIVPMRDVDALVAAIEGLRTNDATRAAMAVSARDRALAFTWDQYRQNLGEILRDLVGH